MFYMKSLPHLIVAICISSFAGIALGDVKLDFFRAVARDDARTVKRMIERGFDAAAAGEQGQTPLLLALREDSAEVVDALLALPQVPAFDTPNAVGETPLMMAALRGRRDWVLRLLELGAAVNRSGWTPLHYAASGPEPAIVALLLDRGAAVDARAANGNTPLLMAARYGAIEGATLLLARGADPRLRNAAGLSAAEAARSADRDRLADRLDAVAPGR